MEATFHLINRFHKILNYKIKLSVNLKAFPVKVSCILLSIDQIDLRKREYESFA